MEMKNVSFAVFALFSLAILFSPDSNAAEHMKLWSKMCASCHDGERAPDAETIRQKYRTFDEFVAAVKSKGGQCMNILKKDKTLIRKVAREIGLKDSPDE